jgi:hypothetical protein
MTQATSLMSADMLMRIMSHHIRIQQDAPLTGASQQIEGIGEQAAGLARDAVVRSVLSEELSKRPRFLPHVSNIFCIARFASKS